MTGIVDGQDAPGQSARPPIAYPRHHQGIGWNPALNSTTKRNGVVDQIPRKGAHAQFVPAIAHADSMPWSVRAGLFKYPMDLAVVVGHIDSGHGQVAIPGHGRRDFFEVEIPFGEIVRATPKRRQTVAWPGPFNGDQMGKAARHDVKSSNIKPGFKRIPGIFDEANLSANAGFVQARFKGHQ